MKVIKMTLDGEILTVSLICSLTTKLRMSDHLSITKPRNMIILGFFLQHATMPALQALY